MSEIVKVTLDPQEAAGVDKMRGQMPRGTWVRQLVRRGLLAANALDSLTTFPAQVVVPEHPDGCACKDCGVRS